ncbi:MAG: DUF177 domain-containing protein [Crocinitomicaceae bacterium]|nr:DUF177 domain-containing protein [Crocinitomicaceae bacterium]MDG1734345.1 DUF177 domain-containing protein [Crocinitomicaceae bacterium]MDG2505552.1 DUF177 domain-containing protein [Crocinitomicaceae bacterium]
MNKDLEIPFVGLKQGIHNFEFEIDRSFFDAFPYSIIEEGEITVELSLDKKDTLMVGEYKIKGFVVSNCATCNESFNAPINGEMTIYYKFGEEQEEDENLVVLTSEVYKIKPEQQVYELITVSLNANPRHKEGECNEEVLSLLRSYQIRDEKEEKIDPRWDKLNKLN